MGWALQTVRRRLIDHDEIGVVVVVTVFTSLLELSLGLTQRLGQLRELCAPKADQHDYKDDDEFGCSKTCHDKYS